MNFNRVKVGVNYKVTIDGVVMHPSHMLVITERDESGIKTLYNFHGRKSVDLTIVRMGVHQFYIVATYLRDDHLFTPEGPMRLVEALVTLKLITS